ncbi:hypothetical protein BC938DRAFT_480321 [Jimgerdemannia flammicorona]|uniref:Hemerythrin-like domain-containing protein n=1 Tax=Jimgerdemannia flammicorona TaxID=994334 RepID=A0A433QXB8_9FUNG|nr:hypothetical protein BC938DRAFT_480321 [Jimgerdemannia flammicorona]
MAPGNMTAYELAAHEWACAHKPFRRGFDIVTKSLDGHHHIEDDVVFPFFATKLDISAWESDHVELTKRINEINAIIAGYTSDPTTYDASAFEALFVSLKDMVIPHLDAEENTVTAKFMEENYDAEKVAQLIPDIVEYNKKHEDPVVVLVFLIMHTAPEDRP